MHIWNNLKGFLYDKENFLTFYQNKIYVYNLNKIITLTNSKIIFLLNNKKVIITGSDLKPSKCTKLELLITGNFESVTFE